jgi:hypothetical protein
MGKLKALEVFNKERAAWADGGEGGAGNFVTISTICFVTDTRPTRRCFGGNITVDTAVAFLLLH